MFVDHVLANVLVFAVGAVFAALSLRSGRRWIGGTALLVLLSALDWWLVERYLLAAPSDGQVLPLAVLQAAAVTVTTVHLWAQIRRRLSRGSRDPRHRRAIRHALAGEHEQARAVYAGLTWSDPWDVAAWIGLGDVLRRMGQPRRARRCYRRARGVDVRARYSDLLLHRERLLRSGSAGRMVPRPGAANGPGQRGHKRAVASGA